MGFMVKMADRLENKMQQVELAYRANSATVCQYRELYGAMIKGDKLAKVRAYELLDELLAEARDEIDRLWPSYPGARYAGIKFLERVILIGKTENEVLDAGIERYPNHIPVLDYVAERETSVLHYLV